MPDSFLSERKRADGHPNTEIGHEKAQSVIDSITSSYAAEGQAGANPMLGQHAGPGQPFPPPPFGFPGTSVLNLFLIHYGDISADEETSQVV